jgi:hypothetical protein
MTKIPAALAAGLLSTLLLSGAAGADEIADAALALCEKVKACAMSEIAEEDLTDEMRQMMQPMLDNMCANMQARVQAVPTDHGLYQPAVACMRSMQALSCEEMQTSQANTPACQEYEKLARETYGGQQ